MARKKLITALAGTAALALIAGPALATSPYTVAFNGDTSGTDHTVTFTNKATINLAANGNNLPCSNSTLTATVHTGAFSDPATIATIDPATFTGCTFAGFPTTMTAVTPWQLIATGGNTSSTHDSLTGTITGISANITMSLPLGTCKFNVAGTVSGTLQEDDGSGGQQFGITSSSLTVSGINTALTCLGLFSNGNSFVISGTYGITDHPIQIS
jgi:hypothetical protein